jgi:hypothetical protein
MYAAKLSKHNYIDPEDEQRQKKRSKQVKVGVEPKESPRNMDGIGNKISTNVNPDNQRELQV